MKSRYSVLFFVLTAILAPSHVHANECSLEGYDAGPPKHVGDRTPATGVSEFQWSSDVDPFQEGSRGWHFIKNLHARDLSIDWAKPRLVIAFDRPLPKDGIFCSRDYDSADAYDLDNDAPIYVSGDGEKPAKAFVHPKRPSTKTGATIETNYRNEEGGISYGLVEFIIKYFSKDGVSEVTLRTEPPDVKLAFIPSRLGVDEKDMFVQLSVMEATATDITSLSELAKFDQSIANALGSDAKEAFVQVSSASGKSIVLKQIESPKGETPLLLISPDGSVVATTYVNLDQLKDR